MQVRQSSALSLKRSEEEYLAVSDTLQSIGNGGGGGGGRGELLEDNHSFLPSTSMASHNHNHNHDGDLRAVRGHLDKQLQYPSKNANTTQFIKESQRDTLSSEQSHTKDAFPSHSIQSSRHDKDESGHQRSGDETIIERSEDLQALVSTAAVGAAVGTGTGTGMLAVNKMKSTVHVMTATIIEEYYTAPAPTLIAALPLHPVPGTPGMLLPPFRTPSPEYEARWLPRYDYGGDTGTDDVDSFGCDTDDDDDDIVAIEESKDVQRAAMAQEQEEKEKGGALGGNKCWDADSMGDLLLIDPDLPPTPTLILTAASSPTLVQTFSVLSSFSSAPDPQASPLIGLPHPVTPGLFAWNACEDLIQNIDSDDDNLSIEDGQRNGGMNSMGTGSLGSYGVTLLSVEEEEGDGGGEGGMHGRQGIDLWEGNCLEPTAADRVNVNDVDVERKVSNLSEEKKTEEQTVGKYDIKKEEKEEEEEEDVFSGADSNLNNLNAFNFNCGTDTDSDDVEGDHEGLIGLPNIKCDTKVQTLQKYSEPNVNMNVNTNSMNSYNGYDINTTDINTDYNNNSYINFNFNTIDDVSEEESEGSADSDSGAANEERGRFKPDFDFDFDFNFNELATGDDTGSNRNISASRLVSSVMNVGKWNATKSTLAESVFGFDAFSSLSKSTAAPKVALEDFELRTYRERGTYGDFAAPTVAAIDGAGSELNVLNLSNFNFNEEQEVEKEVERDVSDAFQMSELEFFNGDDAQVGILEPLDVDSTIPSSNISSNNTSNSKPMSKKKKKKSSKLDASKNVLQDVLRTFPATYVDIFGFSDEEDDDEEGEEDEDDEMTDRNRDNGSAVETVKALVSREMTDSFRSIESDHLALHLRDSDQNEDSPVSCDFLSICGEKEAEVEVEVESGGSREGEEEEDLVGVEEEAGITSPTLLVEVEREIEGGHTEEVLNTWPPPQQHGHVAYPVPMTLFLPPLGIPFDLPSAPPLPLTPVPSFAPPLSPPPSFSLPLPSLPSFTPPLPSVPSFAPPPPPTPIFVQAPTPTPSASIYSTANAGSHLSFSPPLKLSSTPPLFDFSPPPHPFKFPPPLPPFEESSPTSPRPPPFCFSGPPSIPSTPPAPLPLCFGPPPSSNPPPFCFKVPPPLQFSFTHTPSTSATTSRFLPGPGPVPVMLPSLLPPKTPSPDLISPFSPLGGVSGSNIGIEGHHTADRPLPHPESTSTPISASLGVSAAVNTALGLDTDLPPLPASSSVNKSSSNSNSKGKPLSEQKAQWFIDPADVQVHH